MGSSIRAEQAASNEPGIARATLVALASALLFGASTPAAKSLLGEIDPRLLAGFLYLGCGIALGVLVLVRWRVFRHDLRLDARDGPWLAGAVAAGGVVAPLFLLWGLSRTTASSTALLLVLEAPLTALWARLLFGEHVGRRTVEALVWVSLGAAATVAPGAGAVDVWGCAAVALACAAWALDNNLTREAAHTDALVVAAVKGLAGGTVNTTLALILGSRLPRAGAVLGAGLVGALGYGASLALYVVALRGLGAARAGAYFATAPFVGAAAAVLFLDEPLTARLGAAAVLVGLGVWRLFGERHRHRHRHEALEHSHAHVHDAHHLHVHVADEGAEPHAHRHRHAPLEHEHPHLPDIHHRHGHD
jgi:drug/metabolite transporter (DMT)-like permease